MFQNKLRSTQYVKSTINMTGDTIHFPIVKSMNHGEQLSLTHFPMVKSMNQGENSLQDTILKMPNDVVGI